MKFRLLAFIFFIVLVANNRVCLGQLNTKTLNLVNDFGKQLIADIAADNLHGSISAAVIKDNKVIWSRAFGYASIIKPIPADTNTIYRIGSITKCFTATLLMQLVEEGKVKFDDPVEKYVPEVKKINGYSADTKITIRQLASHTSGLKREPDKSGADVGNIDEWQKVLINYVPHMSFNSKPGEQFLYSNIGFAILGLALERAAGMPYIQMVQQRIFAPLHMNDTFFILPDDKLPRLAQGISNNTKGNVNTKLPITEIAGRGYRVPNGGIFSTPNDLAKFAISIMAKSLLKPGSYKEMQTVPPGGKNYGLGLTVSKTLIFIGHNGSVPGYTSQFLINQDTGYAVILMRDYNFGSTDLEKISFDLLRKL